MLKNGGPWPTSFDEVVAEAERARRRLVEALVEEEHVPQERRRAARLVSDGEKMCVLDSVAACVERSSRVGKPGTSVPRTEIGLMLCPPEYE